MVMAALELAEGCAARRYHSQWLECLRATERLGAPHCSCACAANCELVHLRFHLRSNNSFACLSQKRRFVIASPNHYVGGL